MKKTSLRNVSWILIQAHLVGSPGLWTLPSSWSLAFAQVMWKFLEQQSFPLTEVDLKAHDMFLQPACYAYSNDSYLRKLRR
jgi:hypothetical protein